MKSEPGLPPCRPGFVARVHPKVYRECAGRREDLAACVARVGFVARVHPKVRREFTIGLECLAPRCNVNIHRCVSNSWSPPKCLRPSSSAFCLHSRPYHRGRRPAANVSARLFRLLAYLLASSSGRCVRKLLLMQGRTLTDRTAKGNDTFNDKQSKNRRAKKLGSNRGQEKTRQKTPQNKEVQSQPYTRDAGTRAAEARAGASASHRARARERARRQEA